MAIAAMIKIIATTISSSMSEKPFCFFIFHLLENLDCRQSTPTLERERMASAESRARSST
jgi:hypothetical protein